MKRPTMADIARRAGVTKGAVSFALNGKPGVSEATRRRVLAIAQELGWQPNSAARALSDGRAGVLGLVIDRPAPALGVEPFFMQLISGIQAELSTVGVALLFTLAEDVQAQVTVYREWWASRRVDGVFLVDVHIGDPRIEALEELQLPAVVIGSPVASGSLPAVWNDETDGARLVVRHLAELGHRSIVRVSGPTELLHTRQRSAAFDAAVAELGLRSTTVEADYTGEQGATATAALLEGADRPTAIVYDNDLMAVSGLSTAQQRGIRVPAEVSMIAWDDSPLCELIRPGLTALRRDIAAYGAQAAHQLRALVAGEAVGDLQVSGPELVRRGSTAALDPAAAR
ncbi:LacI family DNA-binding transcriptional regulator [Streptomyces sp. NPDC092296]|uniref:LacI family DNA-binding transcriptional regulator n=1 Tax=Streptomyces sp. NPDC092296 TaxID=3366012 RepID=UPI003816AC1F